MFAVVGYHVVVRDAFIPFYVLAKHNYVIVIDKHMLSFTSALLFNL